MHIDLRGSGIWIALAIIAGSGLVAWSLYVANTTALAEQDLTIQRANASERHLYGSADAPVVIVEFSDYQCPFCAQLHPTLKRIVDESNGQIAWEYRHLPLPNHPLAVPAARLSECVARYAGNDAFWTFTDKLFQAQGQLSEDYLERQATGVGLSSEQLAACRANPGIAARLEADTQAAAALGGNGTPFSVIVFPDNTYRPVTGAVPYEQWMSHLRTYVE